MEQSASAPVKQSRAEREAEAQWPIVVPTTCPQQGAGDDCALFVCKYMECLSKKNVIGLPFSQADMDFIRGKLASAIIQEVNGEKENKSIGEVAVEKNCFIIG
ncbi:hypothetical protein Taro_039978 [Colocasia esculenta]|uniref:Ubiquitin-like protease family profile domain-containing protein n=1 Tax=Colocasia esculenta TaxID=4460 RepID=A0A843WNV0_COLES|nr:hypothetical protein [Colocasia esculenta]